MDYRQPTSLLKSLKKVKESIKELKEATKGELLVNNKWKKHEKKEDRNTKPDMANETFFETSSSRSPLHTHTETHYHYSVPSTSSSSSSWDTLHALAFAQALSTKPTSNITIVNSTGGRESDERHKKSSKEEEEERKDRSPSTLVKATAVTAIVSTVFTATYMLAQDEYATFYFSDIDTEMEDLHNLTSHFPVIQSCVDSYDEWKKLFCQRTKSSTVAKVGTTCSIIGAASGFFLASSPFILMGICGGTLGGAYLFWRHLKIKKKK